MKFRRYGFMSLGLCLVLTLAAGGVEDTSKSAGPSHYPAEMNKKFADPDADIQQFVKRFENDSRDIYAKRQDITRTVGLRPGDAVADIGAGTGLYTQLFAEQVGPKGPCMPWTSGQRSSSTSPSRPRAGPSARR